MDTFPKAYRKRGSTLCLRYRLIITGSVLDSNCWPCRDGVGGCDIEGIVVTTQVSCGHLRLCIRFEHKRAYCAMIVCFKTLVHIVFCYAGADSHIYTHRALLSEGKHEQGRVIFVLTLHIWICVCVCVHVGVLCEYLCVCGL